MLVFVNHIPIVIASTVMNKIIQSTIGSIKIPTLNSATAVDWMQMSCKEGAATRAALKH